MGSSGQLSSKHLLLSVFLSAGSLGDSLPHFRLYCYIVCSTSHQLLLLLSLLSSLGDALLHSLEGLDEERLLFERTRQGVNYLRSTVLDCAQSEGLIGGETVC